MREVALSTIIITYFDTGTESVGVNEIYEIYIRDQNHLVFGNLTNENGTETKISRAKTPQKSRLHILEERQ